MTTFQCRARNSLCCPFAFYIIVFNETSAFKNASYELHVKRVRFWRRLCVPHQDSTEYMHIYLHYIRVSPWSYSSNHFFRPMVAHCPPPPPLPPSITQAGQVNIIIIATGHWLLHGTTWTRLHTGWYFITILRISVRPHMVTCYYKCHAEYNKFPLNSVKVFWNNVDHCVHILLPCVHPWKSYVQYRIVSHWFTLLLHQLANQVRTACSSTI